ncbi:glycosyltransferase family 4 protein [Janthinobacterium sp. 17J80-10]|uniref:glycosyltransferase family 4 protein n=1 Tax=Janthinobacterium sp. 17J80-10 TaxID=2497863 RepID=UPI0010058D0E|nr:glycosyltransferase family 4 protein [Janthinobacterium sp. 17J80-10]QAU34544.1 glycosyltransferase [Janthinobacterium sp. 17J80-10]
MREHCIIVTRFSHDQPGFLDFSYRIRALAKQYQVSVISHAPLIDPALLMDGIEYIVLPHGEGRKGWCQYILACARLLRARQPACVVLLHSLLAPMVWLLGRIPTALYWNEHPSRFTASPPSHPMLKRMARKLALRWLFFEPARRATLVMPIGEAHRDDLLEQGCAPHRVKLIYMGVDKAFAERLPEQPVAADSPLRLVYVGTVSKPRGRDLMLEAIRLANREGAVAHLTLIGASDEEVAYCRRYAIRLGIASAVTVCGRVSGTEIPAIMKAADAGLCLWEDQPWWRFNPPTKLFEYLVSGLPVLASDIRTHTQYVSHGRNGLIFKYDSFSLGKAIRHLARRRRELHEMKTRARMSGNQYLWERIEPTFLQAIRALHLDAGAPCKNARSRFDDPITLQDRPSSEMH